MNKEHEIVLYQLDNTSVCVSVFYNTMRLIAWKDSPDGKILKKDISRKSCFETAKL